jgi:hypothetical protein
MYFLTACVSRIMVRVNFTSAQKQQYTIKKQLANLKNNISSTYFIASIYSLVIHSRPS